MTTVSRIRSSSAVPRRRHLAQPSSEQESAFLPREAGAIRPGKADMHDSPIPLIPRVDGAPPGYESGSPRPV